MPLVKHATRVSASLWDHITLKHEVLNELLALQYFIEEVDSQSSTNTRVDELSLQEARAALGRILFMLRTHQLSPQSREHVSLHQLIHQVMLRQSRLRHTINGPDQNVLVTPVLLETVFHNLIRNAAQAGACFICITIVPAASHTTISITDDGPGISEAIMSRIFEPHFTTRPDGTGIGLSICKRMLQRLNGSLKLDRSHRNGARFVLWLPN